MVIVDRVCSSMINLPCCLCRDGSGCLHAVIQMKRRATPE